MQSDHELITNIRTYKFGELNDNDIDDLVSLLIPVFTGLHKDNADSTNRYNIALCCLGAVENTCHHAVKSRRAVVDKQPCFTTEDSALAIDAIHKSVRLDFSKLLKRIVGGLPDVDAHYVFHVYGVIREQQIQQVIMQQLADEHDHPFGDDSAPITVH